MVKMWVTMITSDVRMTKYGYINYRLNNHMLFMTLPEMVGDVTGDET